MGRSSKYLKDVAKAAGVAPITLRRWLLAGKIPEVSRDRNGWRLFTSDEEEAVLRFDVWWHAGVFQSITEFFRDKPGYCLEAMNYIPTLKEAEDAKHHASGLIWAFKRGEPGSGSRSR